MSNETTETIKKEENQHGRALCDLQNYTIDSYITDVNNRGLCATWNAICDFVLRAGETDFLNVKNFSELYESGLALEDKFQKKSNGQYFTPDDVALVMCDWFSRENGEKICDVACGTGKLILTFLDFIGNEKATDLIKNKRVYLYDIDNVALKICKTSILLKYGVELCDCIHDFSCDFLSSKIVLPDNSKVISNPPYAKITNLGDDWENTTVLQETKELYSCFMEKILKQSSASVVITPYSFISSEKFYSLRKNFIGNSGEIYSFDNVPGNIFCGRKHGIFNSNTSNAVRAAITTARKSDARKSDPKKSDNDYSYGFRLTPLIRFKSTERKKLLQCDTLESFLGSKQQTITDENQSFVKCFRQLETIYEKWREKAGKHTLGWLSFKDYGRFQIAMPNTCRYFTTAADKTLNRGGQVVLFFEDENAFYFSFCLINSSFAYWWWRLFDGGITYNRSLLLNCPSVFDSCDADDFEFFKNITTEMIQKADDYKITKNNVGIQENIKYPREYRDKLNERFLKIIGVEADKNIFDVIHSNMALEVNL